jgi:LEA14-like dessication related protein
VRLRIENDAPDPIVMEGASHQLFLDGVLVGSGVSHDRIEAPRFDSIEQTVTMHVSMVAMVRQLRECMNRDVVDYRVTSDFFVRQSDRSKRFRITGEGWVDFRDGETKPGPRPTP